MNNKQDETAAKILRYHLYGWLLFVACALLFIVTSIVHEEMLMLTGSIIFLLACLFFLVPLVGELRNGRQDN